MSSKRSAPVELHPGGLAEVLQELLAFVLQSEATLQVKPAELGRPSAGYIASLVSPGSSVHITTVGGTPELALSELHRVAMADAGQVPALTAEQLGCYHRAGDQTIGCSNPRCPGAVASLSRQCAPREHIEDLDRPGHCVWCRHQIERVSGVGEGTRWRVVLPAGVPNVREQLSR